MDYDRLKALVGQALRSGAAVTGPGAVHWDIAGNCTAPYITERRARPSGRHNRTIVVRKGRDIPMTLEIATRCRKCQNCAKARSRLWRGRALSEINLARRTWMGTITLSASAQSTMRLRARAKAASRAVPFDDISQEEQLRRVIEECFREITLYIKRVRKNSGAAIRYLLVTELHASGLPHFHVLIHETGDPVTYRQLSSAWALGFTKFKLISDNRAAGYVCKYLTKSALARVRASVRYGNSSNEEFPSNPLKGSF